MKQNRTRSTERERLQKRVRAQMRTERVRQGYDEADLPRPAELQPGPLPSSDDPEQRDFARPFPENDPALETCARLTLRQLLRSRPAVVPLQLVEHAGRIEVIVISAPRSPKVRDAYQELAALLRFLFAAKPSGFSEQEWQGLLWGQNVSPGERLALLARLAIAADTRIALAKVPFTPNDRSLKRFQAKFAALPDGTPFSLRLLLRDQRGKKNRRPAFASGFLEVPDPLLLMAVRKAFALEAGDQRARSDYDIGPLLHQLLAELGIPLQTVPTEEEVRTLRERRVWKKLGLFPKAATRQKDYLRNKGESP